MFCAHGGIARCNRGCYANGGEVMNEKLNPHHEPKMNAFKSIAEKIRAKKMAKGGMVDEDGYMSVMQEDDDFDSIDQPEWGTLHGDDEPEEMAANQQEDEKLKRRKLIQKIFRS